MVTQPEVLEARDEDRALVSAFQAGEEGAFGEIVRAHYPTLLARARRRLGNTSDAEDAVQETFLRAYLALDRFAGEFRLGAWLNRILVNTCADAGARRAGEVKLRDRLASRRQEVHMPDEAAGDPELRRVIREAIDSLPESYRVAFVLREIEEKPYSEVAETMAVTEENARARVHRARSTLARTLREASAGLGALALPFRLLVWRRHGAALRPEAGSSPAAAPLQTLGSSLGPFNPASLGSAGPSLGSLGSSAVPQAISQLSASPLSQNLLASVPDISRTTLPLASTALTALAAGAAAVLPNPVGAPAAAVAPPSISAPGPGRLSAVGSPGYLATLGLPHGTADAAAGPVATSSAVSTATAGSASSSGNSGLPADTDTGTGTSAGAGSGSGSSSASGPAPAPTSNPALVGPAAQWSWVGQAAWGSGSGRTPTTTGSQSSTLTACPYAQSFPLYTPGAVALGAPEQAGAAPSASLATNPVTVSNPGDAFEANATGPATDGTQSGPVQASMGVCPAGAHNPMLLANLASTTPGSSAPPILQVRAALVSTFSSSAGTDSYYRGVGVWLTGPDSSSPAVPLVAEVVEAPVTSGGPPSSSQTTVGLLVAFYGPVSDMVAPGAASCTATSNATGSTGTSSTSGGSPGGGSGSAPGTSCGTGNSTDPQSTAASGGTAPSGSP